MAEHVNETDPFVHEPKGASTATSGQVYVADGIGSGTWTTSQSYGGMVSNNVAGATEINNIGTTAQKITGFSDNMSSYGTVSDHATDNDLTVDYTGHYEVHFNSTLATSAVGDAGSYIIKLRIDGSVGSTPENLAVQHYFSGTDDLSSVNFSGIVSLSSNDALTVWIESDEAGDTDDLLIYELGFWVNLLRRTV